MVSSILLELFCSLRFDEQSCYDLLGILQNVYCRVDHAKKNFYCMSFCFFSYFETLWALSLGFGFTPNDRIRTFL